jgi:cardiolipin synthase
LKQKFATLPNLLSLARLPLAAAFVLADSTTARILIVAAVALTDIGDGFFARRMRSHDRSAGQIVDPVTDKLFVLIALIAFAVRRDISLGQLFLLLLRDAYNTFAFFILKALHWKIEFKARLSGKTVTVLQLACVFALLFWHAAVVPLVWLVAAASVFAIQDYTRFALRQRKADN